MASQNRWGVNTLVGGINKAVEDKTNIVKCKERLSVKYYYHPDVPRRKNWIKISRNQQF